MTTNVLSLTKNVGEMGHHVSQVDTAVDVLFPVAESVESVGTSGRLSASAGGMDGAVAGAAVLEPQQMRGLNRVGVCHPVTATESQSTGVCSPDSDGVVSLDLHGACITIDAECKQRRQLIWSKNPNRAALKQKELKIFQTVNHAQIIWNPQTKPKGILGGHINIRSI